MYMYLCIRAFKTRLAQGLHTGSGMSDEIPGQDGEFDYIDSRRPLQGRRAVRSGRIHHRAMRRQPSRQDGLWAIPRPGGLPDDPFPPIPQEVCYDITAS